MKVGDQFLGTSLLDTEFHGSIDRELDINGTSEINPMISGHAWIIGTSS